MSAGERNRRACAELKRRNVLPEGLAGDLCIATLVQRDADWIHDDRRFVALTSQSVVPYKVPSHG